MNEPAQPVAKTNSAEIAKALLRSSRQGALATLMPDTGAPYCSLVNVAPDADGAPILLISALAVHTKNLVADPRVSLMLHRRSAADPLQDTRIMLAGNAARTTEGELPRLRRRYLAFHPSAEDFVGFGDFSFFRIVPRGLHLVAGFGRIVDLSPDKFLTDVSDAGELIAAEPQIVAHMNEDHRDALALYATKLIGAPAGDWRCIASDPEGLDMEAGGQVLRLTYPERVTSPLALRTLLKNLAEMARAKI